MIVSIIPGRVFFKKKVLLKYIKLESNKAPYQQKIIFECYLVGYTQILASN